MKARQYRKPYNPVHSDSTHSNGSAAAAGTTEALIERRLAAAAMEERLAELDERLARAQGRRRAAAALLEQGGTTPDSALRVAPAAPTPCNAKPAAQGFEAAATFRCIQAAAATSRRGYKRPF